MTYTRKVAYNTLAQLIGRVILVATSLVTIGILTRHLGVANFGRYTTALAYVAFFGIFADLGFFFIAVREMAIRPKNSSKIVANVMAIRMTAAVLAYALGFGLAWLIPAYDTLTKLAIGLAAAAFFWQTIQNTLTAVFQVNYRMDKAVICDVFGRLIILVLLLILVSRGAGLLPIMAVYLIGNFANFTLALILANRYTPIRLEFDWRFWKKIIKEALPMGVAIVLHLIYFRVDTIMLSVMKGAEHVGIYGPSYKILEVMLILPAIFISSVLPIYSRYLAKKDRPRLIAALQKSFDFLSLIAFPVITGIFLLAKPIVNLIAGPEFLKTALVTFHGLPANSALTLQVLILAALGAFLAPAFIQLLVAGGYQRLLVWPNIGFVMLNVILNAIFIPRGSYLAAAFTTLITELTVLVVMAGLSFRVYKIFPKFSIFFKAILASGVMAVVVYWLRDTSLILSILAGLIVYLVVMFALRGLTRDIVKLVLKS